MPLDDFREAFPSSNESIDAIVVQVNEGVDIKETAEKAKKKLMLERGVDEKTTDFVVRTPEELLGTFNTVLNILTSFLLGVAAISLLVGGIGVANTMYTSVIERTKEIGVMKAVGARNKDIVQMFTIESGLIGLGGGAMGVIFGITASKIIEFIAQKQLGTTLLQVSINPSLIIGCLIFAFVIGALSGSAPAFRASKISPVEALRYE